MGISLGIAQLGGDPVFKPFGDKVLQSFSLFVHFIPREVEHVMKKAFQQPMVTQDFERAMFSSLSQNRAVVLFITNKSRSQRRQPLKHSSDGRGSDFEPLSQRVARYPLFLGPAEFQNRFQVIVD